MEKSEVNVSIGNSKLITINDRQVLVEKLGLVKYTVMTRSVKDLISNGIELVRKLVNDEDFNFLDTDENVPVKERGKLIAQTLTEMLEANIMQAIKLIDICVPDLGYDYICQKVGLVDAIEILKAVVEVNKLQQFGEEIKNLLRGLQLNQLKNNQKIQNQ